MQLLSELQNVTSILFSALGALCLAVAFLLLLTYWLWDRTKVILSLSVHFLIEAAVMMILALTPGAVLHFDIDVFRLWVVWLRFAMLINLGAVIFWQVRRFSERGDA